MKFIYHDKQKTDAKRPQKSYLKFKSGTMVTVLVTTDGGVAGATTGDGVAGPVLSISGSSRGF